MGKSQFLSPHQRNVAGCASSNVRPNQSLNAAQLWCGKHGGSRVSQVKLRRIMRQSSSVRYSHDSEIPAFSSCFSITMMLALNLRLSDLTAEESARMLGHGLRQPVEEREARLRMP